MLIGREHAELFTSAWILFPDVLKLLPVSTLNSRRSLGFLQAIKPCLYLIVFLQI